MTHQLGGEPSLKSTDSHGMSIKLYYTNKKAAVTFAESFQKSVNQDETLRSITTIQMEQSGVYCVSTVIIDCSDGISETMLKKLAELFNT